MNGRFQMQGGKNWILPGTLIGWKSGQATFIPLWDLMEGAWLWTQESLENMQKTNKQIQCEQNQRSATRFYIALRPCTQTPHAYTRVRKNFI